MKLELILNEVFIKLQYLIRDLSTSNEYPRLQQDFTMIKEELRKSYTYNQCKTKKLKKLLDYYELIGVEVKDRKIRQQINDLTYLLIYAQEEIFYNHFLDQTYESLTTSIVFILDFLKIIK